jgi:hypothetical protein
MEAVNKCLEAYLCHFSLERQAQWIQRSPLAEWWYNSAYHSATKMTPFEVVYGQFPSSMISYLPYFLKVREADNTLTTPTNILHALKDKLVLDLNHMKQHVNQHHFECHFEEGDQVFLHL